MVRCLKSLLGFGAAAFVVASWSGCAATTAADAGNCGNVTCPTGCDISSDCTSCIPESASAGAGSTCTSNTDCCTGTCVNGTCTPPSGGTSSSSSSGGSSGAGNVAVGQACTGTTSSNNCSSQYCKSEDGGQFCACNKAPASGGTAYPCQVPSDCCTGATCTNNQCVASASSSSSSSGSSGSPSGCKAWTGSPVPTYDQACNPTGGTADVCSQTGTCIANCTVTASVCTTGETCNANGHCSAPASSTSSGAATGSSGSSGSSSSTGGTSTGGTSSGSGSSSSGLATACTTTLNVAELTPCDGGTSGCPTGLICANDPNAGPTCEYACTSITNCPDLITNCDTTVGSCVFNLCGVQGASGTTNGSYDGTCAAASTADGTCFPIDASGDGGAAQYGLCLQGGSITNDTATCSLDIACAANDLCGAGWFCNSASSTATTGSCVQLCSPTTNKGCASGTTCTPQSSDVGVCVPNTSSSSSSGGTSGSSSSSSSSTGGTSSGSKSSSASSSSGSSSGSLPGDTCSSCDTTPCSGTNDDCVCDPNDPLCSNGYCANDCYNTTTGAGDQTQCTGGTQCIEVSDATGSGGDDGNGNDYACYPASGTCIGASGVCGASGTDTGRGGDTCAAATDCCSQYCVTSKRYGSVCECNPAPEGTCTVATQATDCNPNGSGTQSAGGVCTGGTCQFPCASDSDCCTGGSNPSAGCMNGFCQ